MMRVGVLASGSGSNFEALAAALNVPGSPAQVVALGCNVEGARCLERAERLRVPTFVESHRGLGREAHDAKMVAGLKRHGVELVCLAGYMRLVTRELLDAFPGRVLNLHPSLLPSFPGLHAARQALQAGVKVTGVTVHLVDDGLDSGPIIAQRAVEIRATDDEASLLTRLHAAEHALYTEVVKAAAQNRLKVEGRRAFIEEAA